MLFLLLKVNEKVVQKVTEKEKLFNDVVANFMLRGSHEDLKLLY